MIKEVVFNWLQAGAPFQEGARLFSLIAGKRHPFNIILRREAKSTHMLLKSVLLRRVSRKKNNAKLPAPLADQCGSQVEAPPAPVAKLRDDWPFLHDPDCPAELKILAADKISLYYRYTNAHNSLFDCTTSSEQFATAKQCVESYIENRLILKEFKYYRQHKTVLGQHTIFAGFKRVKELRKLNIVELVKLKEKLEHNIWRIDSEIKKNDKPHLAIEREARLKEKRNELTEVERLIKEYTQ